MRTIEQAVTVSTRCSHCSRPEILHSPEEKVRCQRLALADISRSWPRSPETRSEIEQLAVKRLRGALSAIRALTEEKALLVLTEEEKRTIADMRALLRKQLAALRAEEVDQ